MRSNTFLNPTCSVNTTNWTQVNQGAGTTAGARMTTGGLAGVFSCYYRQTWSAVTTGAIASTGIIIGSPTATVIAVTGGQPFVISGWSRSSHAGRTVALVSTFTDGSGTAVGGAISGAAVDVSGGWTRVSVTGTAPAGAVRAYVRLYAQGGTIWAVNDTLDLGGVLSEVGTSVVGGYFDGDSLNCLWAGTVGGSVSSWLSLASTSIRRNVCPNPALGVDATGWATNIGAVVRVAQSGGWAAQVQPSVAPGGYLAAPAGLAGEVGSYWTGGVVVSGPAGRQVNVQLHDGTAYLTAPFVVTLVTGLMLVQLKSSTPIAAGDVGTPRLYVYPQAGWLAGEYLTATGVTVEQVAAAGVVFGLAFDGEAFNAKWVGTRYASESASLAAPVRSTFPLLEVEAWPGVNPTLTGVPSSPGRFLTDRARAFKIGRGRQYELAQDEAAQGSLMVNNSDGAVTGGTNGCTPITSARVRASWNGVPYPVWTGLVRSWPREDPDPSSAWSEVELTDTFEPLANRDMVALVAEEIQYRTTPDAWYPMNEPASSTSLGSLAPGGPAAPLVSFKLGSIPFSLGSESVFAGTSETVLALANATGTTNRASQYQIVGPQNPGSGYSLPFGAPWSVGVFVRATAGGSVVWSALDWDGSVMAAIQVDVPTKTITGLTRMGGIGGSYVNMPVPTGAMLNGCYIHMGHDGTNAFTYVYGVTSDGTLYAQAATGAQPITTGTSRWVAWGCAFRSDAIYYSSNADMQMCHGTIWTTSPPTPYGTGVVGIATAGLNAFYSYNGHDQIGFLAAYAGAGLVGDPADVVKLGQVRDTVGTSALDALRAVTGDYLGRLFMTKDGQLSWQSVHHGMGAPAQWVFGGKPGELPYTGSPGFDYDPTFVYNDVQVQRPDTRGVAQQTTATKALARVTNPASEASYFQRVLQVDSNVRYDADAAGLAGYLSNRYAQPAMRVRTVRFDASANPALWPFVLGAELGDTVVLNHRALGRPDVSLSLSVQSINHEIDAQAGTWFTDMELSPWSSDWTLAAMHTTVAATVAAGVTSITIAPLSDAATNPAEASLGVGTQLWLSPFTSNVEAVTVLSVVSTPTAGAAGYTGITVTLTAPTANPHTVGDLVCDPLPTGVSDPTAFDAFSVLGSTTVLSI